MNTITNIKCNKNLTNYFCFHELQINDTRKQAGPVWWPPTWHIETPAFYGPPKYTWLC